MFCLYPQHKMIFEKGRNVCVYTEEHEVFHRTCFWTCWCWRNALYQQCRSPGCLAQLASPFEVAGRRLCALLLSDHLLSSLFPALMCLINISNQGSDSEYSKALKIANTLPAHEWKITALANILVPLSLSDVVKCWLSLISSFVSFELCLRPHQSSQ